VPREVAQRSVLGGADAVLAPGQAPVAYFEVSWSAPVAALASATGRSAPKSTSPGNLSPRVTEELQ
jgi:hypothetical protein